MITTLDELHHRMRERGLPDSGPTYMDSFVVLEREVSDSLLRDVIKHDHEMNADYYREIRTCSGCGNTKRFKGISFNGAATSDLYYCPDCEGDWRR